MRIHMRRACLPFAFLLFAISIVAQAQPSPRFDGVQITVGVQDVSAIGSPARAHARTWKERTGGSVQDQITFMRESVAYLENEPRIYRYAWFAGRTSAVANASLLGNDGQLTALGQAYVDAPHNAQCGR